MFEAILPSVISGLVAIAVCVINNTTTARKNALKVELAVELIKQEIISLSKEVEKHNSVVERTYKLESDYALLKHDVDILYDTIRKDVKK